jgi:hypothetical protein
MRGGFWIGARVSAGIAIVVGLLAFVAVAWWTRGVGEATQLFQLLQGVILGTLGYLYGTQGVERAQDVAARESTARREAESLGETAEERAARLERDLEESHRVIRALLDDERLRPKLDEATRRMEGP